MSTYQNYLHPYSQGLNNPVEPYRQNSQQYPPQLWSNDPYDAQGSSSSSNGHLHPPTQLRWIDPHNEYDDGYDAGPHSANAPPAMPIPSPSPTPSPAPPLPELRMPPPPPRPTGARKKVSREPDIVTQNVEVDELRAEIIRLRQTVGRLEALLSANGISIPPEQIKAPSTDIFNTKFTPGDVKQDEKLVSVFDGDHGYQADESFQGGGEAGPSGGAAKLVKKANGAGAKVKKRKRAATAAGSDIEEIPAPKPKSSSAGIQRDALTGKRIEKGTRKTALGKVVRAQIQRELGLEEGANLPVRPAGQTDAEASLPDWSAGIANDFNSAWVDRVATATLTSLLATPNPSIAEEDINLETITTCARTAFINYCKRWVTESDPDARLKRELHTKQRRRWGRKDLKQKRRVKAAADIPTLILPEGALLLDYMSSEYSSPGPDSSTSDDDGEGGDISAKIRRSERRREGRRRKWDEMRGEYNGGNGDGAGGEAEAATTNGATGRAWNKGHGNGQGRTKVLEVRPPLWRSAEYNNLYAILEAHASTLTQVRTVITPSGPGTTSTPTFSAEGSILQDYNALILANPEPPRNAHVAPSHVRFIMPDGLRRPGSTKTRTLRKGKAKKEE